MNLLQIFIYITLVITIIHAGLEDFDMPIYSTPLSKVITDYMVNYMMSRSPVVNLYQVSHTNNTISQLYIMNEILYAASRKSVIYRVILDVEILPSFYRLLNNRKRFNNVVFIDSCNSFQPFFSKINVKAWEYQGNFILAITRYSDKIYSCMTEIFEAFWSKHIVNVVIMFMSQTQTEVLLYTFYPFSEFYCERAIPIQLNQYQGDRFLQKINYFPDKLNDFYGCKLSVATFNNPPFFMYKHNALTGTVEVDGIEGILLRVLSQRLNFNVDIYESPDNWGYVYENGTSTGKNHFKF